MRSSTPGMHASTPGIGRLLERIERRGICAGTRGMRHWSEIADSCGIHRVANRPPSRRHASGLSAQQVGVQVPRARWERASKKPRSRARSGQLQCRVGRARLGCTAFQSVKMAAWHTPTFGCGRAARWVCPRHDACGMLMAVVAGTRPVVRTAIRSPQRDGGADGLRSASPTRRWN